MQQQLSILTAECLKTTDGFLKYFKKTKRAIKCHGFSPWMQCLCILQKAIHMKKLISPLLPLNLHVHEKLKTCISSFLVSLFVWVPNCGWNGKGELKRLRACPQPLHLDKMKFREARSWVGNILEVVITELSCTLNELSSVLEVAYKGWWLLFSVGFGEVQ